MELRIIRTIPAALLAFGLGVAVPGASAAEDLGSQTAPLSAPTLLTIGHVTISFEHEAYLNLMPRVFVPRHKIDCARDGSLIVPIRLSASSALPSGLTVDRVWVHAAGKWWSGTFDRTEGRLIARGCPRHILRPGEMVDVIVRVEQNGKSHYLRAAPKQLGAAY